MNNNTSSAVKKMPKNIKNSTLIKRLKKEMERKSLNALELAELANVGKCFVYDILSGKSTNPTAKKLSYIAKALDVDMLYLLDGGEVKKNESNSQSINGELIPINSVVVQSSECGEALVIDEHNGKPYYFHEKWITDQFQSDIDDLRVIIANNDNMCPTLCKGDMAIMDISDTSCSKNDICALFYNGELKIKRIEILENSDAIRVISDNPNYSSFECMKSDVKIIGRIIWLSRNLK